MAQSGRWEDRKDSARNSKSHSNDLQIKSAEFRAAKKIEEEALMAALGVKIMPPPSAVVSRNSSQEKPSIKSEPMTPANTSAQSQSRKPDMKRKEDRRRRRQVKATGSDEEKRDWSENDEDDLVEDLDDEGNVKKNLQEDRMTEKELEEFLIDLVKKHGLKNVKQSLKSKKEQKDSGDSDSEKEKSKSKHKHKKKKKHGNKSKSPKRHRTSSSSSDNHRSKRRHN